jgi:hypothetical protein
MIQPGFAAASRGGESRIVPICSLGGSLGCGGLRQDLMNFATLVRAHRGAP